MVYTGDYFGLRGLIKGHVQGVGFRYHTRLQAKRLGICGWVRNLPDGSVEVCMYGTEKQLNAMKSWLECGPEHAIVNEVLFTEVAPENFSYFAIY